uniref:Putative terminase n=1 Tax=viral metagenome TaxID=1070528 RepID=A0A6H1ZNJ7_9ZZZZ
MATTHKPSNNKQYDGSTPLKSVRQEMFIWNILQGMSQMEAYKNAKYSVPATENAVAVKASQLVRTPNVVARLTYTREQLQRELREKTGITQEKIVAELAKLAFSNMQDFVATDGEGNFSFNDWDGLSREQLAAVESIKITTNTTSNKDGSREFVTKNVTFKLHSKPGTLELLGKHLGIFEADNRQKADTLAIFLRGLS